MKGEKRQIVIGGSGKYSVELLGEGASAEILGAFVAKENESLDIEVKTIHRARKTRSETFIRAVAKDNSRVNLRGLIKIEKKAQETDAFLKEDVLLVSEKAQADAIPDLEIEANDVKASHAATVGKIDSEQLFYLMSRGVRRKQAEEIIVDGFLAEVERRFKTSRDELTD